ncbi:MAG TPA: hypothetical protein VIW47_11350 [Nitrospiraceae bacterium]
MDRLEDESLPNETVHGDPTVIRSIRAEMTGQSRGVINNSVDESILSVEDGSSFLRVD